MLLQVIIEMTHSCSLQAAVFHNTWTCKHIYIHSENSAPACMCNTCMPSKIAVVTGKRYNKGCGGTDFSVL